MLIRTAFHGIHIYVIIGSESSHFCSILNSSQSNQETHEIFQTDYLTFAFLKKSITFQGANAIENRCPGTAVDCFQKENSKAKTIQG